MPRDKVSRVRNRVKVQLGRQDGTPFPPLLDAAAGDPRMVGFLGEGEATEDGLLGLPGTGDPADGAAVPGPMGPPGADGNDGEPHESLAWSASWPVLWSAVDKTLSSLADLTTRSATDLSSGTLADARLSSNVPLKNGTNAFTNPNSFTCGVGASVLIETTGSLATDWALHCRAFGASPYCAIFEQQDTGTATIQYAQVLRHTLSAGVGAAGCGVGMSLQAPDDAGVLRSIGQISADLTNAATAAYASRIRLVNRFGAGWGTAMEFAYGVANTSYAPLLFSADNTHDIGAAGATRPRDFYLARDATIGGLLTVTGFGSHSMTSSGAGNQMFLFRNTHGGATSAAGLLGGNDARVQQWALWATSSGFTPVSIYPCDGAVLEAAGPAGLHIACTNATGVLRFMTNSLDRIYITAAGNVGIGETVPASKLTVNGDLALVDGMTAPGTTAGYAKIYVDSADGDLKVKFGDGFVRVIAADS